MVTHRSRLTTSSAYSASSRVVSYESLAARDGFSPVSSSVCLFGFGALDPLRAIAMSEFDTIRLTQFAKRAGCAAKQAPDYLLSILAGLPPIQDPNVLVGHATADDAAVYRLSDDLALILTTDFFTPIVDRPYDFGAIAAANALSDVYAMAGTPLAALSLVGFPNGALPVTVLGEILRGAADKALEAGIAIVGGHTIQTDEPIFGLAVVGRVDPRAVITNAGAKAGDLLILTKPLGLGIITTAAKRGEDRAGAIGEAIGVMTTLNRDASRVFAQAGAQRAHRCHRLRIARPPARSGRRKRSDRDGVERRRARLGGGPRLRGGGNRTRWYPFQPAVPRRLG